MPNHVIRLDLGRPGMVLGAAFLSATLGVIQVLLGGDSISSAMFAGATFFGLLAVAESSITSTIGLLSLLLVGRFLIGAYICKNLLMGEAITARLYAPESTAAVMLLGFFGAWLGTALATRRVRALRIFSAEVGAHHLLTLSAIFLTVGILAKVGLRIANEDGDAPAGGIWGIAKNLAPFANLALPTLMLYLWRSGTRRWLTHPAVISMTLILFAIGVLSTSKQSMAEPLAFFTLMALSRYGWRHPFAWICIPLAIASFQYFVFPVSQYARFSGSSYKNMGEAAIATGDIVAGFLTDPSFREYVNRYAEDTVHADEGNSYLSKDLAAFGRFAMIGEADRLISATDVYQTSGWETISESLLLQVPHFLYPWKPLLGTGSFLGRYAGDLAPNDFSTQAAYGFMANAYNAFGLSLVPLLAAITSFFVLGILSLICSGPAYANPWSMFALAAAHQSYVEATFSGQAGMLHVLIVATFVLFASRLGAWAVQQVGAHMGLERGPRSLISAE